MAAAGLGSTLVGVSSRPSGAAVLVARNGRILHGPAHGSGVTVAAAPGGSAWAAEPRPPVHATTVIVRRVGADGTLGGGLTLRAPVTILAAVGTELYCATPNQVLVLR